MVAPSAIGSLEFAVDEGQHLDETLPSLDSLANLLRPNEQAPQQHRTMLEDASEQIVELIKVPLIEAQQTQKNSGSVVRSAWAKAELESKIETGKQALEFFDYFCEFLTQPEGSENVRIAVHENPGGGIRIAIFPDSPDKDKRYLGKIVGEYVSRASILIRTGEKDDPNTKTPLQLNFRLTNMHNEESASLRIDLHEGEEHIAVDSQIGGDQIVKKHQRVGALDIGNTQRQNFEALLANFTLQFVENRIAKQIENGKIAETVPGVRIEDDKSLTLLQRFYLQAKERLGINREEAVAQAQTIELERIAEHLDAIHTALGELFETESTQAVADGIRQNAFGDYQRTADNLDDEQVVINWLLRRREQTEITPQIALQNTDKIVVLRSAFDMVRAKELPLIEPKDNSAKNILTAALRIAQDSPKIKNHIRLLVAIRENV